MAKQAGMGDSLLVDGYNLSGDVGSLQRIGSSSAVLDTTAIDKSGMERIYGLYDGAIEFTAFFNVAANQEHAVLKAKGSGADRVCTYLKGGAIGNMGAAIVAKQVNYDPTRGADGSLTEAIQMLANKFGLDFGAQLTAGLRTDTGATNGASMDNAAASSTGWAAYLHVTAFDGTDATITLEDSANDSAWAVFTASAFTQVTAAPTAQRIAGAAGATVRRYIRVATAGTFNSISFVVVFTRTPYAL